MQHYQNLWRLFRLSKLSKPLLFVAVILILIESASAVGFPYLTQILVDGLTTSGLSWPTVWILLGVLVIGSIAQGVASYLLGKLGQQFVSKTRTRVHGRLIHLPVGEFEKNRAAEPAGRLVNDTNVISRLVSQQVLIFVSGVTTLVASLIILWFIDTVLTGVLFACVLGSFLCILPLAGGLTKISTDLQAGEANFIARLSEVFGQIRLVKSAVAEKQEIDLAQKDIDFLYSKNMSETRIFSLFGPLVSLAVSIAMISILVVGASRVAEGAITIGALVAFILYLFNIVMPLAGLSAFVAELNKATGAAQRLSEIESLHEETKEGQTPPLHNHPLVFENVTFSYASSQTPALHIESLEIPANSVTAVVGQSGSGKSTLFSLLNRFYLSEGISIAKTPITKIALPYWRRQLATVAQNAPVLSGSVRFNLCYGMEASPDDETLIDVLKDVQLWPFLESLQGLDTEIGEQGNNISGGQKQRLSIASALLRDPEILILDEATSSLDSNTEQAVNDALQKLQQQRTCLVAAHRLNTVVNADRILVLKAGCVVDFGDHKSLLTRCDHYRQLVEKQLLSDEPEISEEVA